jgi:hypothetical protein
VNLNVDACKNQRNSRQSPRVSDVAHTELVHSSGRPAGRDVLDACMVVREE